MITMYNTYNTIDNQPLTNDWLQPAALKQEEKYLINAVFI